MRSRERAGLALVVTPFVVGGVVGASAAGPGDAHEVCAFGDRAITEASGLVLTGGHFVTMNDSGDSARVFTLDASTCRTVGVTRWHADPEDDEGLAPAGAGHVWVGDIGDNLAARRTISVARVPVGPGDRTVPGQVRTLAYPDGPHDAETLLRDPTTGRLYVVSKEFIGHVYAAPARLGPGVNQMTELPTAVMGLATDGAFLPDGKHVVLRSYGQAVVYTWPALERVATVDLPRQRQGEGIAVGPGGRVYLSSEGDDAPVLELPLPDLDAAAASSAPTASGGDDGVPGGPEGWRLPILGALVALAVAGVVAWRRR
jgi:hypothetical protein